MNRPTSGPLDAERRRLAAKAWLLDEGAAGTSGAPGASALPGATRVKLCGMSRPQDVDAACAAGPDFCGFVVDFPKSHRSVAPAQLSLLTMRLGMMEGAAGLDHPLWRVGVFVDKPTQDIVDIVCRCGLDLVQLHGHETAADVRALRAALPGTGIIQAFRVSTPEDVARACESPADMVLLDNGQGTGESFDWSLTARATRPFMLAGGLGPHNVAAAIAQVHPWGVDMSSGIETDKVKDPTKMKAAVAAAKGATL